nr:MAG TPA: hypothetical protein [Caudoviricetes sp.]
MGPSQSLFLDAVANREKNGVMIVFWALRYRF